jgi:hypothetical protein
MLTEEGGLSSRDSQGRWSRLDEPEGLDVDRYEIKVLPVDRRLRAHEAVAVAPLRHEEGVVR